MGVRVCGVEVLGHASPAAAVSADAELPADALHRVVELVRTAGGTVAIQCEREGLLPQACTLAAAWMSDLDLFPSPEVAAAWIAIARAAAAPVDMPALRRHWARRWLACSLSTPAQVITRGVSADPPLRERYAEVRPGGPAAARRQLLSRDGAFTRTCPELRLRRDGRIKGHITPECSAAVAVVVAATEEENPTPATPHPPQPAVAKAATAVQQAPRPRPFIDWKCRSDVGWSAGGRRAARQSWAGAGALVADVGRLLPQVFARVLPLLLLALLLLPPFPAGLIAAALVALGSVLLLLLLVAAALPLLLIAAAVPVGLSVSESTPYPRKSPFPLRGARCCSLG